MKNIFDNPLVELLYSEEKKYILSNWKEGNGHITIDELKALILRAAELIIEYKPIFYLSDNTKQEFGFDVEIQEWVATTMITPCIQVGTQKFALVMPQDILANMSLEQTASEVKLPIDIGYFNNQQDAMKWFGF